MAACVVPDMPTNRTAPQDGVTPLLLAPPAAGMKGNKETRCARGVRAGYECSSGPRLLRELTVDPGVRKVFPKAFSGCVVRARFLGHFVFARLCFLQRFHTRGKVRRHLCQSRVQRRQHKRHVLLLHTTCLKQACGLTGGVAGALSGTPGSSRKRKFG